MTLTCATIEERRAIQASAVALAEAAVLAAADDVRPELERAMASVRSWMAGSARRVCLGLPDCPESKIIEDAIEHPAIRLTADQAIERLCTYQKSPSEETVEHIVRAAFDHESAQATGDPAAIRTATEDLHAAVRKCREETYDLVRVVSSFGCDIHRDDAVKQIREADEILEVVPVGYSEETGAGFVARTGDRWRTYSAVSPLSLVLEQGIDAGDVTDYPSATMYLQRALGPHYHPQCRASNRTIRRIVSQSRFGP